MDKKFVEKIKAELLERQNKIQEEIGRIADKNEDIGGGDYVTKYPNIGDDMEDNIDEFPIFESNLAIEQNLEKTLRDIKTALKRIDEGSYGTCKYCGKEIDQRRLEARPVAGSCMSCKSRILKQ